MFDIEAGVELSELFVYELCAIVGYDRMWHAIATYDIFPDKLLDLLSMMVANGLASIHLVK